MGRRRKTTFFGGNNLLADLETWAGRSFRPGLEHRGVLRDTVSGEALEVEITIRVRRHAGADELRERRAEVLAFLRQRPDFVRHCGVNIEKRSSWGGHKRISSCEGRIVAAVVDGAGVFLFVCSRHREKHGLDQSRVLAVIELTPSELREAQQLEEAQRFAWELKTRAEDHDRGHHRSGEYLQGFKPGATAEEIRRYWNGGRGGRIAPCLRCLQDAAAATAPPTGLVCSGCGDSSPGALPGMDGKVFCSKVEKWVPVVSALAPSAPEAR